MSGPRKQERTRDPPSREACLWVVMVHGHGFQIEKVRAELARVFNLGNTCLGICPGLGLGCLRRCLGRGLVAEHGVPEHLADLQRSLGACRFLAKEKPETHTHTQKKKTAHKNEITSKKHMSGAHLYSNPKY